MPRFSQLLFLALAGCFFYAASYPYEAGKIVDQIKANLHITHAF